MEHPMKQSSSSGGFAGAALSARPYENVKELMDDGRSRRFKVKFKAVSVWLTRRSGDPRHSGITGTTRPTSTSEQTLQIVDG
jgi:hypothetical protein